MPEVWKSGSSLQSGADCNDRGPPTNSNDFAEKDYEEDRGEVGNCEKGSMESAADPPPQCQCWVSLARLSYA